MSNKSFNEMLENIKLISNKLNDPNTSMEESINLFKEGKEIISQAKTQLETLEGEIKKVLDNDELEDFN
ncbi:exodeoxyribonuclease VII small subunit [Spiroplasma apis]|uniref:Exodeoxyribonuclease VII small subunit n=1 Tax=Spiroplasma apis B31 TaxID=1276258 RepID=V5RIB7_SPIAP|nr:exodeoxyribonuclease VII small subunit [Spiroplasma apis]AHB36432.1 hypothetical protein SAPIS_v1c05870 [Spiroplasma apis B31]